MGSGGILTGHDVWSRRADSYVLHQKTNENLQRGRWDPCGIHMDSDGILLRIKWDPCGIPGRSKEEVERESQWRGWGREGMKTNDRSDGNTTLEMNNYVAYALPGA